MRIKFIGSKQAKLLEDVSISAQIAKTYRDAKFAEYQKIQEIKACETLEELEAIEV